MPRLKRKNNSKDITRKVYWANKSLRRLEKKREEVLVYIRELEHELSVLEKRGEIEKRERIDFDYKVPVITELSEKAGQPLKAVQSVGKGISFVYISDGKEVFYSYEDANDGAEKEIARLTELVHSVVV